IAESGNAVHVKSGKPVTIGRSEKMSKSKLNVVDPAMIIDAYGADTARLFMLSDSPPDRDLDWTDSGIEGAWRYVNRLWRLVTESPAVLPAPHSPPPPSFSPAADVIRRLTHKTIAAVSDDLDRFHFNRAVARIRELTNALEAVTDQGNDDLSWVLREGLEAAICLIGPMMPHITEELWQQIGHKTLLVEAPWPKADNSLLIDENVTIAVQVNGKLRGTIEVAKDLSKENAEAAALALPRVQEALQNKPARKIIVVPNRIINVVL
ncbi:MAG: class I tRNA ligase family protein, partial [Rhodospirillales bacterium]